MGENSPPTSPTATKSSYDFERIEPADAIRRYLQSSARLDKALAGPRDFENTFERLDLSERSETSTCEVKIKFALDEWNDAIKYHGIWAKYTPSLQYFFAVLNPLADFIQHIGKTDGLVCPVLSSVNIV